MKNKRGLSAVVATLIIILLVLVAVGIIWVVISNVLEGGAEQIELSQKCSELGFEEISVSAVANQSGNYTVSFERTASGEEISGIKITLFNETANSGVIDFGVSINRLQKRTVTIDTNTSEGDLVLNATGMRYTPFFESSANIEQLCTSPYPRTYEFVTTSS